MDVTTAAAQGAVLQLQIDAVEVSDLSADVLDVPVPEPSDAAMGAAQQILVEIEYSDLEAVAELPFQTAGVGGNAAQIVIGRYNGEPLAGAALDQSKRRSGDPPGRQDRGVGFEFEGRHEVHSQGL